MGVQYRLNIDREAQAPSSYEIDILYKYRLEGSIIGPLFFNKYEERVL